MTQFKFPIGSETWRGLQAAAWRLDSMLGAPKWQELFRRIVESFLKGAETSGHAPRRATEDENGWGLTAP
jgi:hypothetical protein